MLPLLVILCALAGFSLALFIHFKKKQPKPLVCPLGHSCDPVVHSDYSRIIGIPVELLGILYYCIILFSYLILSMYPGLKSASLELTLLGLSGMAFLFSIYLTAVQAFVLKEWCTWCLISATLCATIFFLSLHTSGTDIPSFLASFFLSAKSYTL